MLLAAHRGFRSKEGENTIVDFNKALKIADSVEFDIRMTKDKKIVIFHDHNFKRIGNIDKTVRNLTYSEILQLDFFKKNPRWTPPLFIEDFILKIAKEYKGMINVEIKSDRYSQEEYVQIRKALELLYENTNAEIVVSSFSKNTLKWIKTLDIKKFKKAYLIWKPNELDWDLIKGFDYVNPYINTIIRKNNIDTYKKLNLKMNIWTIKTDEDVKKVLKIYPKSLIHSLISDNPLDLESFNG